MGRKLRVLDLFSGIGGFSLGLERAGMETVAFCEIEEFPRKVLRKHWPEVPIYDDVRTLTAARLAADGIGVDVICGGFPCQPFSVSGERLGREDDRHLWPQYLRLIKELRPTWVIGENVVGISDMELDNLLADLDGCGYPSRAFDIPACAVGAKQERRRIWIVAHPSCGDVENMGNVGNRMEKKSQGREATRLEYGSICSPWDNESEPSMDGMGNGIPRTSHRLKGLGNAVVPQIPEIIGRAIIAAHNAPSA